MPSTETKHLTSLAFDLTQMQAQLQSIPATVEEAAKAAQDAWNNNFSAGAGSGGTGTGGKGGKAGGGVSGVETTVTATKAQLESLLLSYKNFEATLSRSKIYPASIAELREQAASAISEIETLSGTLNENGRLTGQNAESYHGLVSDLKESKGAFAELKTQANDSAGAMRDVGDATDTAGKGMGNFLQKLSDKARWLAAFYLIQGIINGFKNLISTVKETETAVVGLQRVLNEDVSSSNVSGALYDIAYEYGRTFEEVQESATLFAQTGKSWDDVLTLTRGTMLALNTAELDVTQATQGLIAVMAQWNLQADDYVGLIDKINKTADDYAITSEAIVAAMQRAGGTAKAYGMSLDELIGIITALGEATGRSGENLGTAINSLITYTTRAKSLNVLEEMGIQAKDAEGNMRPVLDLWSELAQKIKGGSTAFADFMASDTDATEQFLADSEEYQQAVAETVASGKEVQDAYSIAGAYRKNYFIALLNNLGTAEEAVRNMTGAEGYSVDENTKYMATLAAASNQLTASWKQLAVAFGDAGFLELLKWLADMGIGVANLIEDTGGLKVTLFTLLGILITIKAQQISEMITGWGQALKSLVTKTDAAGKAISGLQTAFGWVGVVVAAISLLVAGITAAANAAKEARDDLIETAEASKKNYDSVSELVSKYKELASASGGTRLLTSQLEEARDIQDQIVALTGQQGDKLDLVNGKLDEQIAKLEARAKLEREETIKETKDALRAAEALNNKGMWNVDSKKFVDFFTGAFGYAADSVSAMWKGVNKEINDSLELLGEEGGFSGSILKYVGQDGYEDAVSDLDLLIDAMQRAADAAEASGIEFDNSAALAFLKALRDEAQASIDQVNMLTDLLYTLQADDSVKAYFDIVAKTQAEFDAYVSTLKNPMVTLFNEDGSVMSEEVRAALIEAAEKLFPDFAKEANRAAEIAASFGWGLRTIDENGNPVVSTLEDVQEAVKSTTEQLDDAQSSFATLMDVVDSYNETGVMTADMLQQLMGLEPEYLALLEFTADGIRMNESATNDLVSSKEALIQKMIALKAAEYAATIESNYASGVYNSAGAAANNYSGDLMSLIQAAYSMGWTAEEVAARLMTLQGMEGIAGSAALAMANDMLTASRALYTLNSAQAAAASGLASFAGAATGTQKTSGGGGGGGGEDPQIKILEARKKAIEDEAKARIDALKEMSDAEDRKRRRDEYLADKSEALADVRRAQSRSGIEAREDEANAEKKLAEVNSDWQEQLQDWNLDDQIAAIEAWKEAMVDAIDAQLDALKNAGGGGGGGVSNALSSEAEVLQQNLDVLLSVLAQADNENLPEKLKEFYDLFNESQYTSDVDFGEQLAEIKTDWDTFSAENGDEWAIHYNMVLDDGSTMSPEQINEYINGLLGKATSENDLLRLDKEGLGILLRVTPETETNKETEDQWSQTVNDLGEALYKMLSLWEFDNLDLSATQKVIEDAFGASFEIVEQSATATGDNVQNELTTAMDDSGAGMLSSVNLYAPQIADAWRQGAINPMIAGLGDLSTALDDVLLKLGSVASFNGFGGFGGIGSTTNNTTQSQNNFFTLRGTGTTQINPLAGWMAQLK